jgi:hypothetical protein
MNNRPGETYEAARHKQAWLSAEQGMVHLSAFAKHSPSFPLQTVMFSAANVPFPI